MAKIKISVEYDASSEVQEIIDMCEQLVNMDEDKSKVRNNIEMKLKNAFEEGREFQRNHSSLES